MRSHSAALAIILSRLGKKPGRGDDEKAPSKDEDPCDEGLLAASEELLEAVEKQDARGVASALESAFAMLDQDDGKEDAHDSEGAGSGLSED